MDDCIKKGIWVDKCVEIRSTHAGKLFLVGDNLSGDLGVSDTQQNRKAIATALNLTKFKVIQVYPQKVITTFNKSDADYVKKHNYSRLDGGK